MMVDINVLSVIRLSKSSAIQIVKLAISFFYDAVSLANKLFPERRVLLDIPHLSERHQALPCVFKLSFYAFL